jgi:uncharacterized protein YkwD
MHFSKHCPRRKSRRQTLISICVVFLAAVNFAASASAQDTVVSGGERLLFSLINQERIKAGLAPLQLDERLAQAARKHTQLMVRHDVLSHQFDDEQTLQLRLSDEKVRCDHDGENIALDSDIGTAHVMLMQSPHHRDNILSSQFNAVGIGILKTDDLFYITEDFAHVLPNYSEVEADANAQQAINQYVQSLGLPVPKRRPQPLLSHSACDMALDDTLDSRKAGKIPGVSSAVAWTATDLGKLPPNLKKLLAQPLVAGYSLGVCFAPSVSHPGGVYWLVMVIY